MVRAQLVLAAVVIAVIFAGFGVWFVVSEYQGAQERRHQFFGSPQPPATTGGQKMKIEW